MYALDIYLEEQPDAWRYFIDAQTGDIVRKKNLLSHGNEVDVNTISLTKSVMYPEDDVENAARFRINGTGTVYTMSPNLNTSTSTETLHRLDNLSPRKLRGDNITVDYYNNTDASSSTGTFNYTTSNAHFDEVMVYYHGDEFEAWMIGKGMGNTQVGKVSAVTRHNTRYASSTPSLREIYFMDGASGLNNPTKEAAVIVHEYMHVVSETYNDLELNLETDAMDEAYSDYFGLAYRNTTGGISNSIIGEYIDQPGGFNYTRNLTNSYTMDDYATIDFNGIFGSSYHEKSVIFSGALWDLRNDNNVNAAVIDELVLESLGNLDSSPSFLDGMYALIAAANSSGYSSYVDEIEDAFIGKKIFTPPSLKANIIGPNELYPGQFGMWFGSASNGTPPYSYEWQKRNEGSSYWYIMGYTSTYSTSSSVDFDLKLIVTDSQSNTAYKQISVDHDGGPIPKVIGQEPQAIPEMFGIAQNYPNPFNPSTTLKFDLPETSNVSIKVFNLMGQEVVALVNQQMEAGSHTQHFEASNLSSGFYFARIEAVGTSGEIFTKSIKMQLIK